MTGRRRPNPELNRPVPLCTMASYAFRDEVDAAARAQGQTRSEFIREAPRRELDRQAAE